MAAAPPSPTWTRRVPGSSLLLFFLTTTLLTFFAVEFWNVYEMAATGSLTLLAALLPLELVYVLYYARPVWTAHVGAGPAAVEVALHGALDARRAEAVVERRGVLRLCSAALRVPEPPCAVGWAGAKPLPTPGRASAGADVFFVSESRDVKAVLALRDVVGSALSRCVRGA